MPAVLEGAVPRPSLHLTTKVSWQPSYNPHKFSAGPTSSPVPMSPESLHSYIPHHHDSPIHSQDLGALSSSGWFAAPIPAPDHQSEASYVSYAYDQSYTTPVTSSVTFTPPAQFPKTAETVVSVANPDGSVAAYSPVSDYSRVSEHEYKHQPDESYPNPSRTTMEPSTHLLVESNHPARPRSSPSTLTHQHHASTGSIETPWAMNPLGISAPSMHEQYYHGATYPSPRRLYAPIAPHPIGQHRAGLSKRSRDDDESSEQSKRRKRSDSGANMPVELGEEDKLLIKLKDEESMPWKDIAARFQSDLGKTYQIPALQMRLKRLRERMRVWTETDVRALRMAHEYWVQSKFDIISQKMLEYGAAEKWTARQCARKWAEIDPGPTPYTTYDHHSTTSYAPYTMSPVEAPFMPYLHIQ